MTRWEAETPKLDDAISKAFDAPLTPAWLLETIAPTPSKQGLRRIFRGARQRFWPEEQWRTAGRFNRPAQ